MYDFFRDLFVALLVALIAEQSLLLTKGLIWLWTRVAPPRVAKRFRAQWEADSATIKEPLARMLFALSLILEIPGLWYLYGVGRGENVTHPDYSYVMKITRALDILLLIALAPLMPLFVLLLLTIRIQSGSTPLYRDVEYGYGNKPIYLYRFRLGYAEDKDCETFSYSDERRLTPVGKHIATHGLWRVPLVINVLLGDLSFIGPHSTSHNPHFAKIRPGLIAYSSEHLIAMSDYGHSLNYTDKYEIFYLKEWSIKLWGTALYRGTTRYIAGIFKHFGLRT